MYRGMDIGTAKAEPGRARRHRPPPDRRGRPVRGMGRGSFCDRGHGSLPRSRPGGSAPFSWAVPAFTCTPSSTALPFPGGGPRWSPNSSKPRAPRSCTAGWPSWTRLRRPGSGRATAGACCERWRSQLAAAAPFPVTVPGWALSLRRRGAWPACGCPARSWRGASSGGSPRCWRPGFAEEVRSLARRPAGLSRTARQALGYRELLAHVEGGVAVGRRCGRGGAAGPASSLAASGCGGGGTPGCAGSGRPKTPWQYCLRCWETGA